MMKTPAKALAITQRKALVSEFIHWEKKAFRSVRGAVKSKAMSMTKAVSISQKFQEKLEENNQPNTLYVTRSSARVAQGNFFRKDIH